MARVFLSNETYNAATSGAQIFGAAGTEQVNVFSGTTGVSVTSSVERVDLAGNIADFTFSSFGAAMTIRDTAGNIVATVSDSGGKSVVFSDGALSAVYAGTTLTLGGVALTGTAAAIAPAAADIDATTTSDAAGSTTGGTTGGAGQTFTLTTGSDISGTLTGSADNASTLGDDTYVATNATLNAGDIISDSSGTDVMNIAASGNIAAATIIGVETINANFRTFAAPTIDAANIVGGTINVSQSQAGGSTNATIDNLGVTTNAVIGAGITGTVTVNAEEGTSNSVTLDRGNATTVNIVLDGTAGTDSATVSTTGTVGLDTSTNGQVENLTLSGNGDAVTFNIAAGQAPESVTFTGSQDVTLGIDAADIGGETVTDSTTAGTTTLAIATATGTTHDLSDVDVDVVDLTTNTNGGYTFTVQNGQAVTLSADMTANGDNTIDSTNLADQTDDETLNLTVEVAQGTNDTILTDFEIVNLIVDDGDADNTATISIEDFTAANATVNVSGSENLEFTETGGAAIGVLNATNLSGVLTVTADANLDDVTGGSGNDVITATQATTVSVDGGAGTANQLIISDSGGGGADATGVTFTNFQLVTLNDDATDFNVSQLAGQSFAVNGDVAGNAIEINEAGSIDSLMIDLSALVIDTATVDEIIVDGTQITGAFGANNAQTFIGNDTADTYTGNGGADTITGGEGADNITGGAGNDIINLTEDTSAVDTVTYATGTDGMDTITGFENGSDIFDTDFATSIGLGGVGTIADVAAASGAVTLATDADAVFEITGTLQAAITDYTSGSQVLAAISGTSVSVAADGEAALIVLYDGGNAYLYEAAEGADGDAVLAAEDITLVGTFVGIDAGGFVLQDIA